MTRPCTLPQPSLAGRAVLVTRPKAQAERLCELIQAAGAHPVLFPALEIIDPPDLQPLQALIDRLEQFDVAIFVSPTAVQRGLALIQARRSLPVRLRFAAIGQGSARELRRHGVVDILVPERGADSEALLALAELADMRNRAVVIFRGLGGRELLGDTLRERGASVEYAECYRRVRPNTDAEGLLSAWRRGEVHAVTVTSREALENLVDMLGARGHRYLFETPLFVPHARIAEAARALGITEIVVTEPGDEGLVTAVIGHFSRTS